MKGMPFLVGLRRLENGSIIWLQFIMHAAAAAVERATEKTFNFASFGPGVVYSGEGGLYAAVGAKFEVFCELSGRVGLHWKN